MIEAVMFWNEPNNKSHWDFQLDPAWDIFAAMINAAGSAVAGMNPGLTRVLGGISAGHPAIAMTGGPEIRTEQVAKQIGLYSPQRTDGIAN